MYFGTEDQQPKLYAPVKRACIKIDKFAGFEKSVKKFIGTLKNFNNSDNPFFNSLIYGAMYKMTEGQILDKNKARDVLGNDFYSGLFDIKDDIRTLFGYFDRCLLVNQVLAK